MKLEPYQTFFLDRLIKHAVKYQFNLHDGSVTFILGYDQLSDNIKTWRGFEIRRLHKNTVIVTRRSKGKREHVVDWHVPFYDVLRYTESRVTDLPK